MEVVENGLSEEEEEEYESEGSLSDGLDDAMSTSDSAANSDED